MSKSHLGRSTGTDLIGVWETARQNSAVQWTKSYPGGVPEVFLACGGNFRCWQKADTSSAIGLTEPRVSKSQSEK